MASRTLVEGVVDDRVEADVDAFALGGGGRLGLGPDVEADDDGVRRRREHDVALGDAADRRVHHVEPHLLGRQPGERVGERLDRALHVGLDDDAQLLGVAGLDLPVEVLERDLGGLQQLASRCLASRCSATWRAVASSATTTNELPASGTRRGRGSRPASTGRPLVDLVALVVDHRADAAGVGRRRRTDRPGCSVPSCTSTVATGAAAAVELGLDDRAARRLVGVGLELEHVGLQQQHLEQVRHALAASSPRPARVTVSPPQSSGTRPWSERPCLMRSRLASGLSILLTATTIGTFGGAGVVDGLDRLRHDAVVGRDHQHDDVGHLGAAGAHGGERLVAGRVEEGDAPAVHVDGVGADVLRDAAGLAGGDVGLADGVEQRRLAVVDVAHDRDHRRARSAGALRWPPRGPTSTADSASKVTFSTL